MSAVYCIKKILCFSELENDLHAISNYIRLFLWLMLIHLLFLFQGYEIVLGLLYGPVLLSLVFKIFDREVNKTLVVIQMLPFLIGVLLDYFTPNNYVSYFLSLLTIFSLACYILFLWIFNKKLCADQYHKVTSYVVFFLIFLLIIHLMYVIEGYSYVFVLFSPKITLAIFLICSIAITAIHLIQDQIPAFVQTRIEEMVGQADDSRLLLVESIESYFTNSKQFLNPCFTFEKFANEMDTPRNILSTVINREMNKSFYQLLAEHRIEHAKTLLINQDYLFTIESVVYDCGFNSKSSFHKYFKQFVGTNPSDFRDYYLKNRNLHPDIPDLKGGQKS